MGKVINIADRRPTRDFRRSASKRPVTQQASLCESLSFVQGLGIDLEAMGIDILPELQIEAFLGGLSGYISSNSIAIAEALLKDSSLEELLALAKNSNQFDWRARPGYFLALVKAIRAKS